MVTRRWGFRRAILEAAFHNRPTSVLHFPVHVGTSCHTVLSNITALPPARPRALFSTSEALGSEIPSLTLALLASNASFLSRPSSLALWHPNNSSWV